MTHTDNDKGFAALNIGGNLLGFHFLGLTGYMFDRQLPLFTRELSLFHGWLPVLLVWLLFRLGYDKRALPAWTGLAAALGLVCYLFTPPAGAHTANPNLPININYLYGFNDLQPQHWVNQNLYVVLWLGVLWLVAFWLTHLVLRRIFVAQASAAARSSTFNSVCHPCLAHPGWIYKCLGRVTPHREA